MSTARQVLLRLQEISSKYLSGSPALDIESIARELKTDEATIRKHIAELAKKRLVQYQKNSDKMICLTEEGKTAIL
jgi:Mn-dependent DtxR family transcriptional regulator